LIGHDGTLFYTTAKSARAHFARQQNNIVAMLVEMKQRQLLLRGCGLGSGVGVFLGKSLHPSGGVDEFLFASEKRMAA
jgi:hypothetical protein